MPDLHQITMENNTRLIQIISDNQFLVNQEKRDYICDSNFFVQKGSHLAKAKPSAVYLFSDILVRIKFERERKKIPPKNQLLLKTCNTFMESTETSYPPAIEIVHKNGVLIFTPPIKDPKKAKERIQFWLAKLKLCRDNLK